MVTFSSLMTNDLVFMYCPSLAEAAHRMGAEQIRNRATIGGNVAGAAPAADGIPPLLSVDAQAVIARADSIRTISVLELMKELGENSLPSGEMIVEFILPVSSNRIMAFEKIGKRKALAVSRLTVAISIDMADNKVEYAAIAVGAVGKTAYRACEVEQYLSGKELTSDIIASASLMMGELVEKNLGVRQTAPYKAKIAAAILNRGLERIREGAGV